MQDSEPQQPLDRSPYLTPGNWPVTTPLMEDPNFQQFQQLQQFQPISDSLNEEIDRLIHNVKQCVIALKKHHALQSSFGEELAKIAAVLQRLKNCLNAGRGEPQEIASPIQSLEVAIDSIRETQSLGLARNLRREAEFLVRRLESPRLGKFKNFCKSCLYESSTPTKVLMGVFLTMPIALVITLIDYRALVTERLIAPVVVSCEQVKPAAATPERSSPSPAKPCITSYDIDETVALLVLVGIAGAVGSAVSVFTRIRDYDNERYRDSGLPILTGFMRPLIGGALGILMFALVSPNLKLEGGRPFDKWFTLFAIAFSIGFSERFAKDMISRTEPRELPAASYPELFSITASPSSSQPPTQDREESRKDQ
jgi:hypothetical protein